MLYPGVEETGLHSHETVIHPKQRNDIIASSDLRRLCTIVSFQHDPNLICRRRQMIGPEGEVDLNASDSWLCVEVGEGSGGGGTLDVLRPAINLLRRQVVDPGTVDGYAEIDDAVFIYIDN